MNPFSRNFNLQSIKKPVSTVIVSLCIMKTTEYATGIVFSISKIGIFQNNKSMEPDLIKNLVSRATAVSYKGKTGERT